LLPVGSPFESDCKSFSTRRILTAHVSDVKPCVRLTGFAHKFLRILDFLFAAMLYEDTDSASSEAATAAAGIL
jgi:hypothetical protein